MLYQSTRGGSKKISFGEAIIKGIADDGGLYVPETIPKVGPEFIASLAGMGYADTAAHIIRPFAGSFSDAEVRECAGLAYNERSFSSPDVTPLHKLDDRLSVMELFHGPTSAFKDVALQLLPPMLTKSLKKTGVKESVAILVATSGDTGKAALEGFSDVPGVSILVFYPKNGVSEAQKLQMITQGGGNVAVAAVDGNFDDAQTGVKAIFADADANRRLREQGLLLSSANSINWGRLMPQIVYYFRAYATLLNRGDIINGEKICFVVPTGNFGNILAGWYAREMGLPVSRFICASNSNKVLTDFISTGVYDRKRNFMVTMSPAMDILISSNLERLLYELSGRDSASVVRWMGELAANGGYDVGGLVHGKIAGLFYGGYATEAETAAAVRDTYIRYGYLMDTHTAVGMHVLREHRGADGVGKCVVVATASPYKFAKDVYCAINDVDNMDGGVSAGAGMTADGGVSADDGISASDGISIDDSISADDIECIELLSRADGAPPVPAPLQNLRARPVRHFAETQKAQMKETALNLLTELNCRYKTEGADTENAD